ncbi:glycosyltransferase, partial [bacterium]|nr:glycosyltransferase [bacterium]
KLEGLPLKEQLGFKFQDKLIGLVANLRPEKNHKALIRAFARLLKAQPSAHLVFAGLDCMDGQLEAYTQALGVAESVHFLGVRLDVPEILNILDVFCLPSKNEGLPLSILEAMACGVPVIGADVIGINEVLTDNKTGLLFPYDDDRVLCEKLNLLLTDQKIRETVIASAVAYVKETYSLEDKINQYRSLFKKLLSNKKSI